MSKANQKLLRHLKIQFYKDFNARSKDKAFGSYKEIGASILPAT